jgi:hypothetical protein
MMCLLAGTGSLDLEDPEIKQWTADGSARLQEFCDKHPKHAALRRFRLPEGVKGEQLVNFIVSELLAETYPALLAGQQLEIASRGAPYPLSVRARLLPSVGTGVLTYWEHCVRHDDAAHRIHCLISPETLAAEKEAVPEHGEPLVVDITALLTMHLLGVLDEVLDYFGQFVLTSDTKEAIEAEAYGIPMPVQRARQLDDWMASKRGRVAIRRRTRRRQRYDPYAQTAGGVWMRKEPDLPEILTDGVGSSVLLASELKTPLYSDEALVRQWAGDEFQVRCFGIVALMAALRERRNLGLEAEARLVAILLESHYRDVPFGSEHLHAAIHELAGRASARNASELNSDPTTGALLRMLGEPAVAPEAVRNVGAATIAACVRDGSLPTDTVDAVAQTISFKIQ